jgi:hypothetical protein
MVHKNPLVFVNYYAPWCYWSNKLAPDWHAPELTRVRWLSPPGLRAVRTGYAYQPPAYCTYRRRRAACAQGPTHCTYWARVPASGVPYVPYRAPW